MSEYNYTQQEIKSMKPNEAQIILQHSIHASSTYKAGGDSGDYNNDNNDNGWKMIVKELLQKEKQQEQEQGEMDKENDILEKEEERIHTSKTKENEKLDIAKQGQKLNNDILSIGFEERPARDGNRNNSDKVDSHVNSLSLILDKSKHDYDNTNPTASRNDTKYKVNESHDDDGTDSMSIDKEQPTMLFLDNEATSTNVTDQNSITTYNNDETIMEMKNKQQQKEKDTKHDSDSDEKWYEVIRSSSLEKDDMPIALYKSLEEAQEFLSIKQELAEKRSKKNGSATSSLEEKETFSIRERTV